MPIEREASSPASWGVRPSSDLTAQSSGLTLQDNVSSAPPTIPQKYTSSVATQTLSTAEIATSFEFRPSPQAEVPLYSKGIQTTEPWSPRRRSRSINGFSGSDGDQSPSKSRSAKATRRLGRKEKEREEDLRKSLRREIEEEFKAIKDLPAEELSPHVIQPRFPARLLTTDEMNAVASSEDFLDFVERSSKVMERALDQDYDVLADYALDELHEFDEDEDEGYVSSKGRRGRRIKEVAQFYDERWSKKRMISDINFSPKVRQLNSYHTFCKLTGLP